MGIAFTDSLHVQPPPDGGLARRHQRRRYTFHCDQLKDETRDARCEDQAWQSIVVTIAAVVLCMLLGALAVFQVLLALGVPLGRFAWGGQHRLLPMALRLGSVASIVIYAIVAAVVATRADLISTDVSDSVIEVSTWVAAGYFFLGIVMNLASRSRSERIVMTPLCAVMGILCGVVALS